MDAKLLILIILCGVSPYLKAQSIIAGEITDSDYYFDIVPDYVLRNGDDYGNGNSYPIDLNGDNITDVTINGYMIGWNFRFGNVSVTAKEHCKIAYGGLDTVHTTISIGECEGTTDRYYNLFHNFTQSDTINSSNNWSEFSRNYIIYDDIQLCTENKSHYTSSAIIGVQLFIKTDTLYGWIRVSNMSLDPFEGASVTIEEYACNTSTTLIDEKNEEKASIVVTPNPCGDILHVRLFDFFDKGTFCLFNSQGKKMFQKTTSSSYFNVDISHLPKGIYIYKYDGKESTGSGKILKE